MNDPEAQRAAPEPGGVTAWLTSPRTLLYFALGMTFAAYLGAADFAFVGDDRYQITGNPHITSWHYVRLYFTRGVWSHADTRVAGDYYRPLFLLWMRVNHMLFGFQPTGWHLAVVGIHLGVTLLVYRLALRMGGDAWGAGLAALVFGLHPAHIESVAYVAGVTDPLAALFLVGSFLCYLSRREKPGARLAAALPSWILYAAALLCKETAAVFPLILLVYEAALPFDFAHGPELVEGRPSALADIPQPTHDLTDPASGRRAAAEPEPLPQGGTVRTGVFPARVRAASLAVAPYLVLTALYLAVHFWVVRDSAQIRVPLSASSFLFTLPSVLSFYVHHLLWPVGLHPAYNVPYLTKPALASFGLPLAIATAAILLLGYWFRRAGSSRALITTAWLLIPLLPVLDIPRLPKGSFLHDRYLYIPSIGLALLVGEVWARLGRGKAWLRPNLRMASVLALAGLLATGILAQRGTWKDELLLAEDEAEAVPDSLGVQNNLAVVLAERGNLEAANRIWDETLSRDPRFTPALYNLGFFSYRAGRLADAESHLLRALEVDRSNAPAWLCLGLARFKMGRLNDAQAALRQAVALHPEGWGYHFALGYVLRAQGDLAGALAEFRQEISINPQHQLAREQIAELQARPVHTMPSGTQ